VRVTNYAGSKRLRARRVGKWPFANLRRGNASLLSNRRPVWGGRCWAAALYTTPAECEIIFREEFQNKSERADLLCVLSVARWLKDFKQLTTENRGHGGSTESRDSAPPGLCSKLSKFLRLRYSSGSQGAEGSHNGSAAVLKTAVRKDMQVRVLSPPPFPFQTTFTSA
jgi:hypothetical protein